MVIGVALVNDTDAPIPFDRATTRLVINGEPVEIFDRRKASGYSANPPKES